MKKGFKHCKSCDPARKALCSKFGICLAKVGKMSEKKPVQKGTYG